MDVGTTPKVTVLIPVYNCERYVGEAIDSILGQTFDDFELLLVDDGSTDGSRRVLESYVDPRIRVIPNERNLGIARTLNRGLALARGRYFAVLDNDDLACPERLAKQVGFLDRHDEYAGVGSWAVMTDEHGRAIGEIKRLVVPPEEVRSQLLFRCCLLHPSMMTRTEILRRHGYREDFVTCADFDLWVRVAKTHRLGSLPDVLVRHREHPARATHRNAARARAEKLEIIATQLSDLGVDFGELDLERHFVLQRMTSAGFKPDRVYLDWAADWLLRLRSANRDRRLYPERPFARVLAATWLKVCRRSAREIGWVAWRCFWRSPLGAAAVFRRNREVLQP